MAPRGTVAGTRSARVSLRPRALPCAERPRLKPRRCAVARWEGSRSHRPRPRRDRHQPFRQRSAAARALRRGLGMRPCARSWLRTPRAAASLLRPVLGFWLAAASRGGSHAAARPRRPLRVARRLSACAASRRRATLLGRAAAQKTKHKTTARNSVRPMPRAAGAGAGSSCARVAHKALARRWPLGDTDLMMPCWILYPDGLGEYVIESSPGAQLDPFAALCCLAKVAVGREPCVGNCAHATICRLL